MPNRNTLLNSLYSLLGMKVISKHHDGNNFKNDAFAYLHHYDRFTDGELREFIKILKNEKIQKLTRLVIIFNSFYMKQL